MTTACKNNDPDLFTATSHVKALVSKTNGNLDKCCTEEMNMMSMSDLEKVEIVSASGNTNYKFESIMQVMLKQDHAATKRKENLLQIEFLMLVSVTKFLLISQFATDRGEMSWIGKSLLQSEITQVIKVKSRAAGVAEAASSADVIIP